MTYLSVASRMAPEGRAARFLRKMGSHLARNLPRKKSLSQMLAFFGFSCYITSTAGKMASGARWGLILAGI